MKKAHARSFRESECRAVYSCRFMDNAVMAVSFSFLAGYMFAKHSPKFFNRTILGFVSKCTSKKTLTKWSRTKLRQKMRETAGIEPMNKKLPVSKTAPLTTAPRDRIRSAVHARTHYFSHPARFCFLPCSSSGCCPVPSARQLFLADQWLKCVASKCGILFPSWDKPFAD